MKKFTTKKSNFKKFIGLSLAGIMTAAIIPFAGLVNLKSNTNALAAANVTVSNSDFTGGVTDAMYSPTDWTAKSEVTGEDVFFIGGRMDASSEENFNELRNSLVTSWIGSREISQDLKEAMQNTILYTARSEAVTGEDNSILAISSTYRINNNTLTPIANTYTFSSKSFSVDAYGYYRVTGLVKKTGDVNAKISTTGLNDDAEEIDITPTTSNWESKAVYFTTKSTSSVNINLAIKNEDANSGTVYYDNLKVEKLTHAEFHAAATAENTIYNDRSDNAVLAFDDVNHVELTSEENGTDIRVDSGVVIDHYNSGSVSYKTNFGAYQKLESLKCYRLAIWINSESANSKFTIKVSADMDGTPSKSSSTTISSTTAGVSQEYAMYVYGNSYEDINFDVEFTFTTEGKHTLERMVAETITADEYTAASGTKLALNTNDLSANIKNGFFTSYISANTSSAKRFPASWTYVATGYKYMEDNTKPAELTTIDIKDVVVLDNKITFGGHDYTYDADNDYYEYVNGNKTERIVKIENMLFTFNEKEDAIYNSAYKCKVTNFSANIENSAANMSDEDNGLLVKNNLNISSTDTTTTYMRSAEISIAASKDVFISFSALIDDNKTMQVKLLNTSLKEIIAFEITGTGEVETYKLYIRGGSEASTYTLNFGIDSTSGVVRLANIGKYTATTFDTLNKKDSTSLVNTFILDLSNNSIKSFSYDGYSNGIYKATSIESLTESNVGTYGIIDTLAASTYKTTYKENLTSKDSDTSTKVLIIDNASANDVTKLNLSNPYTLSSSSYYMITVYAKTLNSGEGSSFDIIFNASNETETIEKHFNNVNTLNLNNDKTNGYQKYVLYVATSTTKFDNFNVEFDLNGKGIVLVDSINVETSSKSAFNAVTEDEFTITENLTSAAKTENKEDEEEETKKETNTVMIFFIVFSSLLLVAAILIAIIYIGAKRLPHHKRAPKQKKPNPRQGKGFV